MRFATFDPETAEKRGFPRKSLLLLEGATIMNLWSQGAELASPHCRRNSFATASRLNYWS